MLSYIKTTLTCCVQADLASVCVCLWPPAVSARMRMQFPVCACVRGRHLMELVLQQGHTQTEHKYIRIMSDGCKCEQCDTNTHTYQSPV